MKRITIILVLSVLTGCAATTPQEARNMGPDRQYRFEVEADYQTAYRRIIEVARNCYQANLITASQIVSGDLYPDTKSGTITVGMYGALGPSLYQVIDVRGLDGSRSEVIATFPLGVVEKHGTKVKAWATGTGSEC